MTVAYKLDEIIYAEENPDFIPRKGDLVQFAAVDTKLKDWQKEDVFQVVEVAYSVPNAIIIQIYKSS